MLSSLMILISSILLFLFFYYNDYLLKNFTGSYLLVYVVLFILALSFISSLRYLFDSKHSYFNLTKFLYPIVFLAKTTK